MPFEFFFPRTFFYEDEVITDEENRELVAVAYSLKEEFPKSSRDNIYTTYENLSNVLERSEFSVLKLAVLERLGTYLQQLETPSDRELIITNSWVSISSPGNYERMHTHPGCYVSGVYYIQSAPAGGRIFFENLDDNLWISERTKPENFNTVNYPPLERRLILFNSSVPHHVSQNLSDSNRIALSFNVALQ